MEPLVVYVTAESVDDALAIGRVMVETRLAACANVIDGMRSVYWWQGAVEESGEAVLILKTDRAKLDSLVERIRSVHDYDCPCIVALPIVGGNPDYLAWIAEETRDPA